MSHRGCSDTRISIDYWKFRTAVTRHFFSALFIGSMLVMGTGSVQAHRFNLGFFTALSGPHAREGKQALDGFLLATGERDDHAGEESDGYLGGLDVYVFRIDSNLGADTATSPAPIPRGDTSARAESPQPYAPWKAVTWSGKRCEPLSTRYVRPRSDHSIYRPGFEAFLQANTLHRQLSEPISKAAKVNTIPPARVGGCDSVHTKQ